MRMVVIRMHILERASAGARRRGGAVTVGFSVRNSFKLTPGGPMRVTPRCVGVTAGPRGAKLAVHSSGRVTRTLSLPGVSHTETLRMAVRGRRDRAEGIHPDHAQSEPALGTEYDTVHGSALLRVTGQVKPSRAEAYATAFTS
jgi:hypothetical protein